MCTIASLKGLFCIGFLCCPENRLISQILHRITQMPLNASLCNRNVHMWTFLVQNVVSWDMGLLHCGISGIGLLDSYWYETNRSILKIYIYVSKSLINKSIKNGLAYLSIDETKLWIKPGKTKHTSFPAFPNWTLFNQETCFLPSCWFRDWHWGVGVTGDHNKAIEGILGAGLWRKAIEHYVSMYQQDYVCMCVCVCVCAFNPFP